MNTTITTVTVNDPDLQEACEAIGRDTVIRLAQELTRARRQHPSFASDHEHAMKGVKSEMLEWEAQAMLVESSQGISPKRFERSESEGYHVITTMLRYLKREYLGHPKL